MTDQSANLPISSRVVALRVSHELRLLSARMHSVESALDSLLQRRDLVLRRETLSDLQQMDAISQATVALADYLERISREMADDDHVDARASVSGVRLRDLADRLSGRDDPDNGPVEMELF